MEERGFLSVDQSVTGKKWELRPSDEREALAVSQRFSVPEVVGRAMVSRGIGLEDASDFLDPSLRALMPNPSVLKDMDRAVLEITTALAEGKRIAVFGDYDVDGATSSALLFRYFRAIGYELTVYIPDRMREGYGPNLPALQKLKSEGIDLVITVDCGITAFDVLAGAKAAGLDVIVLDHHTSEPRLPEALAVVNPNRLDDESDLGHLAAVGVTFLCLVAINRHYREIGFFEEHNIKEPNLMALLDIVALGTVCDVVPLKGLNRALVVQGLKVMAKRRNRGITGLADVAGVDEYPSAYHLGFMLGPRVNAGGRVGHSSLGAELLCLEDMTSVKRIADKLDHYNEERKMIETECLEQAIDMIEGQQNAFLHESLVYVASGGWHAGVIGIVASRLKERYNRPACVVAIENGVGKGSGRSIEGVDLGAAVIAAKQAGLLDNGGGHKMAAGFTVSEHNSEAFASYLAQKLAKQVGEGGIIPRLRVDGALSLQGANLAICKALSKLEPFGAGNSEPKFVIKNVRVQKSDIVGKDHVRVIFTDGAKSLKAIAFRCADTALGDALLGGYRAGEMHVAGKVRIDNWQGYEKVQLLIEDVAFVR